MGWMLYSSGRPKQPYRQQPEGMQWKCQLSRQPSCWTLASKAICSMSPRCGPDVSISMSVYDEYSSSPNPFTCKEVKFAKDNLDPHLRRAL